MVEETTTMLDVCSLCAESFSEDRPLILWLAQFGDEVADAWHKECVSVGVPEALERRNS